MNRRQHHADDWLERAASIRHNAVRAAVQVAIIAPSNSDRRAQYHTRRSVAGADHPSELASRAAYGLRILRSMAYAERIRAIKRAADERFGVTQAKTHEVEK